MRHSRTLLITILALTAGCSTTTNLSERMAGWQGQHVGHALEVWGEPESEQPFGAQSVLIWRDRSRVLVPPGAEARADSAAIVCERMLAVTASGEITGWRWRGDACPALHDGPAVPPTAMGYTDP